MRRKLTRIHSPMRRSAIGILIRTLIVVGKLSGSRARAHWVGFRRRSLRLERPIFVVLYALGMSLLEPRDFAYWSVFAGGVAALFVNMYIVYLFIPRRGENLTST